MRPGPAPSRSDPCGRASARTPRETTALTFAPQPSLQPLVAKLDSLARLDDAERDALLALPVQLAEIGAGQDIVREGDRPHQCFYMLDGMTCAYKFTGEGRRQIVAVHVVGDLPDVQSLHLPRLDVSLAAIGRCRVGFIQHAAMRELCRRHSRLADVFWRGTLVDAAVSREWVLSVGRRKAYNRMAHLFCEIMVRLRAVGLARDYACDLPLTQVEVADALGLSAVHANRVVQELREEELVSWRGTRLAVLDWERLRSVADFDPAYLHLPDDGVAA